MNRYDLINQSEDYFSKGRFDDAIVTASKAYGNVFGQDEKLEPYLFMQYFYHQSKLAEKRKNNKQYQAAINLAYCLQAKGANMAKAEKLFKKSLKISRTCFSDKPEYQLFPMIGCFKIYMAIGDNFKADSCYRELSNVLAVLNQNDIFYKAQSLILYSTFAEKNGDLDRAIALRLEALEVLRSSDEVISNSVFYANVLIKVISDCIETNELSHLDNYFAQCSTLLKNKKDETIYRNYLFVRAKYSELKKDLPEAEKDLLQAVDLIVNTPGNSNYDIVFGKSVLASFYLRNGGIQRASELFDESLQLAEKLKDNKVLYNNVLLGSAVSDYKSKKSKKSLSKAEQIEIILNKQFDEMFLFLPEEEKENYIAVYEKQIDLLNSIHASQGDSLNNCRLYDNVLATKATALESNLFIRNFIAQSDNSNLKLAFNDLMKHKETLNSIKYSGTESYLNSSKIFDSIRSVEIALLKSISNLPGFKQNKIGSKSWLDVKNGLKKGQACIEFINVPADPSAPNNKIYYALILRPELSKPILVKLFNDLDLVGIMKDGGSTLQKVNNLYTGTLFKKLYNLIWDPLRTEISSSTKVFVSLSGILNTISIPVLTNNEAYDVEILSSTRRLAIDYNSKSPGKKNKNAVLYGDIDYGLKESFSPTGARKDKTTENMAMMINRSGFGSLPGTKKEVEQIALILSQNGFHTQKMERSNATEKSFRNLSNNKPNILHLATHGFYFPPGQRYRLYDLFSLESRQRDFLKNPLFRSGLLLAGANHIKSNSLLDDGILSSYDISKLDLSGIDLLVLSACETGLGDIKGGEGVYGLQRAFKLAGVKSLVISLWKVPDEETSILMKLFYSYYSKDKNHKHESLKKAQNYFKEHIKSDPFYWGAFEIVE